MVNKFDAVATVPNPNDTNELKSGNSYGKSNVSVDDCAQSFSICLDDIDRSSSKVDFHMDDSTTQSSDTKGEFWLSEKPSMASISISYHEKFQKNNIFHDPHSSTVPKTPISLDKTPLFACLSKNQQDKLFDSTIKNKQLKDFIKHRITKSTFDLSQTNVLKSIKIKTMKQKQKRIQMLSGYCCSGELINNSGSNYFEQPGILVCKTSLFEDFQEFSKNLVRFRPNIIVCECERLDFDFVQLMAKENISLLHNVKESSLNKICDLFGCKLVQSTGDLNSSFMGTCEAFEFQNSVASFMNKDCKHTTLLLSDADQKQLKVDKKNTRSLLVELVKLYRLHFIDQLNEASDLHTFSYPGMQSVIDKINLPQNETMKKKIISQLSSYHVVPKNGTPRFFTHYVGLPDCIDKCVLPSVVKMDQNLSFYNAIFVTRDAICPRCSYSVVHHIKTYIDISKRVDLEIFDYPCPVENHSKQLLAWTEDDTGFCMVDTDFCQLSFEDFLLGINRTIFFAINDFVYKFSVSHIDITIPKMGPRMISDINEKTRTVNKLNQAIPEAYKQLRKHLQSVDNHNLSVQIKSTLDSEEEAWLALVQETAVETAVDNHLKLKLMFADIEQAYIAWQNKLRFLHRKPKKRYVNKVSMIPKLRIAATLSAESKVKEKITKMEEMINQNAKEATASPTSPTSPKSPISLITPISPLSPISPISQRLNKSLDNCKSVNPLERDHADLEFPKVSIVPNDKELNSYIVFTLLSSEYQTQLDTALEEDATHLSLEFHNGSESFKCTVFFYREFEQTRLDSLAMVQSLMNCKQLDELENEHDQENEYFYETCDKKFILKSISEKELKNYIDNMEHYFSYLLKIGRGLPSMISKIMGMYEINHNGATIHLIVIENNRDENSTCDKLNEKSGHGSNTDGSRFGKSTGYLHKEIYLDINTRKHYKNCLWNDSLYLSNKWHSTKYKIVQVGGKLTITNYSQDCINASTPNVSTSIAVSTLNKNLEVTKTEIKAHKLLMRYTFESMVIPIAGISTTI